MNWIHFVATIKKIMNIKVIEFNWTYSYCMVIIEECIQTVPGHLPIYSVGLLCLCITINYKTFLNV